MTKNKYLDDDDGDDDDNNNNNNNTNKLVYKKAQMKNRKETWQGNRQVTQVTQTDHKQEHDKVASMEHWKICKKYHLPASKDCGMIK